MLGQLRDDPVSGVEDSLAVVTRSQVRNIEPKQIELESEGEATPGGDQEDGVEHFNAEVQDESQDSEVIGLGGVDRNQLAVDGVVDGDGVEDEDIANKNGGESGVDSGEMGGNCGGLVEADLDGIDVLGGSVLRSQDFKSEQETDDSLKSVRTIVDTGGGDTGGNVRFVRKDGLVFRVWRPKGSSPGDWRSCEQFVLPKKYRPMVLQLAHDIPLGGHMGIKKTKDRILQRYYWPGIFKDVAAYCRRCEVCQKSGTRKLPKAGLVSMPLVDQPFCRIAMDFVGPLPRTKRGNRFILVICDYATRYPEAIPLPSTEAARVAKELVRFFSHFGIPRDTHGPGNKLHVRSIGGSLLSPTNPENTY